MTQRSLRIGDTVQYRGGGPVMHVITVASHHCYCNWVDPFGVLQKGTFDLRHLTPATLPASGAAPPD